ncbi:MAG: SBBP repeat-containing protein, partial [Acidobacteriota bacterium]
MRSLLAIAAISIAVPFTAFAQFNRSTGAAPVPQVAVSQPVAFEANLGQSDSAVRFFARGTDYSIFITRDEVVLSLKDRSAAGPKRERVVTRLQFAGSTGARTVEGLEPLPGVSNYYRGNDPASWVRNVPRFGRVRLADVYPGIDFVCYGNDGKLEYDLVVHPGADPSQIRLRSVGTHNMRIDEATGDLVADAARGTIRHQAPLVYDESHATRDLTARYSLSEKGEIGFRGLVRDQRHTLVIDPVIIWSTLHGGNDQDAGLGIATDGTGAAYVAGYTSSTDFPTTLSAQQPANASNYVTDFFDVFVTKFDAGGQTLAYSTYFGGEKDDYGIAIALDSTGAAYVTGRTESLALPVTLGAFQPNNLGGNFDAFVFKLDASGALAYSTFLGGNLEDGGEGIAVDAAGNAYVGGYTWSINAAPILFPRTVTLGPGGGVQDGFAVKLNPTGTALVYSAIVGGSADETMEAIDVTPGGNAYIIGRTQSSDFPVVLPVQATRAGGYDATISRLNVAGTGFDYSTYLGGDQDDLGIAIEVDAAGNAYGTGHTFKPTTVPFPTTPGAYQTTNLGSFDVFVTKLDPAGQYVYSTLLGAPSPTSTDNSYGIGVDVKGNATFAGYTDITGTQDVFLAKLNSSGTQQVYGTLITGNAQDQGRDLAFDSKGYAYITGFTGSSNFGAPLVNPRPGQGPNVGTSAFVVVMTDSVDLAITKTDGNTLATPGTSGTYTITVTNSGPAAATGVTVTDTFPASLTGVTWTATTGAPAATGFVASGSGNINQTGIGIPIGATLTYTVNATVLPGTTGTLSNTATATESPDVIDVNNANNSATDTTLLVPSANLAITKTDGVTTATPGGSVTYTITASNAGPSNATGATVADTFPASLTCTWTCVGAGGGTCTASGAGNINDSVNLPSGGSVTYTASCTISSFATGTLSNTATVTAPGGVTDPVPGNNSATDTDTLAPNADVAITKTDGVTTVTAGGSTTYTITAGNAGPSNASGTTVADTFPASLTCTWTCVGAGGGTCTASGAGNINDSANL